jgi:hypothetical protein
MWEGMLTTLRILKGSAVAAFGRSAEWMCAADTAKVHAAGYLHGVSTSSETDSRLASQETVGSVPCSQQTVLSYSGSKF